MPEYSDARLTPPTGDNTLMTVSASAVALHDSPSLGAEMVTQSLHGEAVHVFGQDGQFVRVQCVRDRYTGWALETAFAEPETAPTHRVSALRTYAYSRADLKSPALGLLSHGALVTPRAQDGRFSDCGTSGWITTDHLSPLDKFEDDPAGVGEMFAHTPYLWGGCESLGLDCTGLTRAAFHACGVILPRDSDMQFAWMGEDVADWQDAGALRRGDLVFWKGHVGLMLDESRLIHANAYHMAVAIEPLTVAIERIAKIYGEPVGARRIDVSAERKRRPDWLAAG